MGKTEKPKPRAPKKTPTKRKTVKKATKPADPDRAFSFKGLDEKIHKINFRQKYFVELYLELHGNGQDAIINSGYNVYNKNGAINYNLARVMASENLRKPNIVAYVNLKMDQYGYNDDNVFKQHLFLINQHSDLSAKSKGIDMFYKVKGSYAPEKKEHTFDEKIEKALDRIADILPK